MAFSDNDKECVIVWEKKPTVEERAKADTLKLPPTFFCGVCSDTDEDNGNGEDFQSELRKVCEAQVRLSPLFATQFSWYILKSYYQM
jgi:E3 SUMO-protein ligase RanBP2